MAGRTTTKKQTTTDINAALMPQDSATGTFDLIATLATMF